MPFDLVEADIQIPATCPVLGISLKPALQGDMAGNSPSIDRIIPSLGYVRGNVRVISWRANQLKNDSTNPSEIADVAAYVASRLTLDELIEIARAA